MEETLPEMHFATGLPGFPDVHRFVLVPWGEQDSPFSILRALDGELEFLVVPPAAFFPEYEPEIDDDNAAELGLGTADDAIVLVIVTVPERVHDATANLLGPLVINRHTRQGRQVVLSEQWSTRQPLVGARERA